MPCDGPRALSNPHSQTGSQWNDGACRGTQGHRISSNLMTSLPLGWPTVIVWGFSDFYATACRTGRGITLRPVETRAPSIRELSNGKITA